MARRQTTPLIQTIGSLDDEHRRPVPPSTGIVGFLMLSVVLLLALVAFGSGTPRLEEDPVATERPLDSSLLHDLGGPVDVVEQFMTALSYGQTEVAAGAIASGADVIELPFLSAPARQVRNTMATFKDIDGVIQIHGCAADPREPDSAAVEVVCSVAYNSDFLRDLDSRRLRGTMKFRVVDGQIADARTELESPPVDGIDAGEAFDRWLIDFYAERLDADINRPEL